MNLFIRWRQRRAERALETACRSTNWSDAERAIERLPGTLSAERALAILLPLSGGHGNTGVGIAGWDARRERLSLTQEAITGRHITSSVAALGRVSAPDATRRLLDIVSGMSGYAKDAIKALGTPVHSHCALDLETRARSWPRELQFAATRALWNMNTKEAFEAYLRLERHMYGGKRALSDEVSRKAWEGKMVPGKPIQK